MTGFPLVTTDWLASRLGDGTTVPMDATIVPVDASWHMPAEKRDAKAEYEATHIAGAIYFDIDANTKVAAHLPHMMMRADEFEAAVRKLGISNRDTIVVYDNSAVRSAARVWWNFRMMGHENVYVLDGGLQKWLAEGRPVTAEKTVRAAGDFKASLVPERLRCQDDLYMNLKSRAEQVVDARSKARFEGTEPEPRKGLRSGHIPYALNVPFSTLYAPDHTLKPADEIRAVFESAGVDLSKPIVTSCGSGVTACVLKMALHTLGKRDVSVYDGSWTEWGADPALPIETGPASSV
ncbi:MAG: 3-mercaptopyruvate sulfurtransferase [Alphaproteobacteria bacterium]|nr:3-mercaptopyruvate sulfurtransferase [Alphaproteobacteria bacterium]